MHPLPSCRPQPKRRPLAGRCHWSAVCLTLCLAVGCGKSHPAPSGKASPPDDREAIIRQVRQDVPRLAEVDKRLLEVIGMGGTRPKAEQFADGNLAAMLLCLNPAQADSPSRSELEKEAKLGPPEKLAAAFRDGPDGGYVSPIQPGDIREVTAEQNGDLAQGTVHVLVPEAIDAHITYYAAYQNGSWTIRRFSLPAWGAQTALQEGRWVMTGAAVDSSFQVRLPSVPFPDPLAALPERLTVFLAKAEPFGPAVRRPSTDGEEPDHPLDLSARVVCDGQTVRLGEPAGVRALVTEGLRRRGLSTGQAVVSIRADRDLRAATLYRLVRTIRDAALSKFALVVEHDENDLREMPLDSAVEALKATAENPILEVIAKPDGTPVGLELGPTAISISQPTSVVDELKRFETLDKIEVRFDPLLKTASFALILSELERPAKPAPGTKRPVMFVVEKPQADANATLEAAPLKADDPAALPRIDGK